jgi:hypothetical protein
MARHATRKRTSTGKVETCCRKTTRRIKYGTGPLDLERLTRELVRA